jgi:hypothetical protein
MQNSVSLISCPLHSIKQSRFHNLHVALLWIVKHRLAKMYQYLKISTMARTYNLFFSLVNVRFVHRSRSYTRIRSNDKKSTHLFCSKVSVGQIWVGPVDPGQRRNLAKTKWYFPRPFLRVRQQSLYFVSTLDVTVGLNSVIYRSLQCASSTKTPWNELCMIWSFPAFTAREGNKGRSQESWKSIIVLDLRTFCVTCFTVASKAVCSAADVSLGCASLTNYTSDWSGKLSWYARNCKMSSGRHWVDEDGDKLHGDTASTFAIYTMPWQKRITSHHGKLDMSRQVCYIEDRQTRVL